MKYAICAVSALSLALVASGCSKSNRNVGGTAGNLVAGAAGGWKSDKSNDEFVVDASGNVHEYQKYKGETKVDDQVWGTLIESKDGTLTVKDSPELDPDLAKNMTTTLTLKGNVLSMKSVYKDGATTNVNTDTYHRVLPATVVADAPTRDYRRPKAQDYKFATEWCEKRDKLSDDDKAAVDSLVDSATQQATWTGVKTLDDVIARRKAKTGESRTKCQIAEDVLEYGASWAKGYKLTFMGSTIYVNDKVKSLGPVSSLTVNGLSVYTTDKVDLSPIATMTSLTSLTISGASPQAALFKKLSDLETLSVDMIKSTDLSFLAYTPELTSLEVMNAMLKGSTSGWEQLKSVPKLSVLKIESSDFDQYAMLPTWKLKELTLSRYGMEVPAEAVADVAKVSTLERLTLTVKGVKDLSPLASLQKLRSISLSEREASLDFLEKMPALREVTVEARSVDDLKLVASLKDVDNLSISGQLKTKEEVEAVQAARGLTSLSLDLSLDTERDGILAAAAKLQNVSSLSVVMGTSQTPLKDLSFAASFAKLQDLSVSGGMLADLAGAKEYLARGGNMTLAYVRMPKAQEAVVAALVKQYPQKVNAYNVTYGDASPAPAAPGTGTGSAAGTGVQH